MSGFTTTSTSLQSNSLLKDHHREPRRVVGTARCLLALDEERELFPEEEIFRGEGAPGTEEVTTKSDGIEYDM